jgi:hypothetical protein
VQPDDHAQRQNGGRYAGPSDRPKQKSQSQKDQRELDEDETLVDSEIESGELIPEPGKDVQKRSIFNAFCKRVAEELVP